MRGCAATQIRLRLSADGRRWMFWGLRQLPQNIEAPKLRRGVCCAVRHCDAFERRARCLTKACSP